MRVHPIADTGVNVTSLGFGGASIGNLYRQTTDDEAHAAVAAAWRAGVRYFDTAPHYGLGLSERRLGQALQERDRNEFVLSTKVGRALVGNERPTGTDARHGFMVQDTLRRAWDFSRDGVLRSIEASLARLRMSRVDVVYIHDPDEHWEHAVNGAAPALSQLRDEGVIRAYGAGMNQTAMLTRFVRETDVDLVMVAGRYTLLEQPALDDLLPVAASHGVSVVNAAVFNSGVLATARPERGARYNYTEAADAVVERAVRISQVCREHGTTLPAAALAFSFSHSSIVSAVVGLRTASEVEQASFNHSSAVPSSLWDELRHRGLLHANVPVPDSRAHP